MCHRCLNSFRYFSIASWSSTVSIGALTLYSSVKTSQPISPCEYSSIRASSRRRTSTESLWAFEERIAVSRFAVRLCLYKVLAGRARLGLQGKWVKKITVPRSRKISLRKSFHQLVSEVTMAQKDKILQGGEMIKKPELVNEHVK